MPHTREWYQLIYILWQANIPELARHFVCLKDIYVHTFSFVRLDLATRVRSLWQTLSLTNIPLLQIDTLGESIWGRYHTHPSLEAEERKITEFWGQAFCCSEPDCPPPCSEPDLTGQDDDFDTLYNEMSELEYNPDHPPPAASQTVHPPAGSPTVHPLAVSLTQPVRTTTLTRFSLNCWSWSAICWPATNSATQNWRWKCHL